VIEDIRYVLRSKKVRRGKPGVYGGPTHEVTEVKQVLQALVDGKWVDVPTVKEAELKPPKDHP
jgi:hypothetical protein